MTDGQRRWLRAAFALVWIAGLAGVLGVPVARFVTGARSGDAYGDVLLALHPSNLYFHPNFYQPTKDALDEVLRQLPPGETTVALVVYGDAADGERLRRNFRVWVYPRDGRAMCETDDPMAHNCVLPAGSPVVVWGLDSLPGYTCAAGEMRLRLCR